MDASYTNLQEEVLCQEKYELPTGKIEGAAAALLVGGSVTSVRFARIELELVHPRVTSLLHSSKRPRVNLGLKQTNI